MQKSLEKALQKISSKLLITDKDLKVLFINSSAEDFLNTTSKKSIGKLISASTEFIKNKIHRMIE